jgi:hypothetical protein
MPAKFHTGDLTPTIPLHNFLHTATPNQINWIDKLLSPILYGTSVFAMTPSLGLGLTTAVRIWRVRVRQTDPDQYRY